MPMGIPAQAHEDEQQADHDHERFEQVDDEVVDRIADHCPTGNRSARAAFRPEFRTPTGESAP